MAIPVSASLDGARTDSDQTLVSGVSRNGWQDPCVGGQAASVPYQSINVAEVYDPAEDTWQALAAMPTERWAHMPTGRGWGGCAATGAVNDQAPRAEAEVQLFVRGANPSSAATTIELSLPRRRSVSLRVYDVAGKLVRTLPAADLNPGEHTFRWDGQNGSGQAVASGSYYIKLDAGDRSATKEVRVLR